jgi:hypothetical protein
MDLRMMHSFPGAGDGGMAPPQHDRKFNELDARPVARRGKLFLHSHDDPLPNVYEMRTSFYFGMSVVWLEFHACFGILWN